MKRVSENNQIVKLTQKHVAIKLFSKNIIQADVYVNATTTTKTCLCHSLLHVNSCIRADILTLVHCWSVASIE